jgi:hypothetical protein
MGAWRRQRKKASSTSVGLYKSPIQKMDTLPIQILKPLLGIAVTLLVNPAVDLIVKPTVELIVHLVREVSEKLGEKKKTTFSLFNSHSIPLSPL